jgi:cyclopropane-fatty-acyl-phospholipid synthase
MHVPAPVQRVLEAADVQIGGVRPWDIRLHDPELWDRILWRESLSLGDSYLCGGWDCDALDELLFRLLQAGTERSLTDGRDPHLVHQLIQELRINLQSPGPSIRTVSPYDDLHPQVHAAMLDPLRIHSCASWEHADSLEQAQKHTLLMICEKLCLRPGQRLLDIGCGWGGLAADAAHYYGVEVVGVSPSLEQVLYARRQWCHLPVRFELGDDRQLEQLAEAPFDRIVSVGLREHGGLDSLARFSACIRRMLRTDGLALLHTIGCHQHALRSDPWIDCQLVPDGQLPSPGQLAAAVTPHFLIEDWQNFGSDYDLTLMAWYRRFEAAWPQLRSKLTASWDLTRAETLPRFWRYSLLSCAAFFAPVRDSCGRCCSARLNGPPLIVHRPAVASVRMGPCPSVASALPHPRFSPLRLGHRSLQTDGAH